MSVVIKDGGVREGHGGVDDGGDVPGQRVVNDDVLLQTLVSIWEGEAARCHHLRKVAAAPPGATLRTRLAAEAPRGAGNAESVREQEQRGHELLHFHHGVPQMLQVHVRHGGGLCARDAVVMLHLE